MPTSQSGSGFVIRFTLLLLILIFVAGSLAVDYFMKAPQSAEIVKKVNALLETETDDGHGISKDLIQKTIDFEPAASFPVGKYEVEEYNFRRTIPLFTLRRMFVVYEAGGAVTLFEQQNRPTADTIRQALGPDFHDPGVPPPERLPVAAGAGGPAPSRNKQDDEDSDDKSGDNQKKDGDTKEDESKDGDTKEGDTKDGDGKEGDGKEGETNKAEGGDQRASETTPNPTAPGDESSPKTPEKQDDGQGG